MSINKILILTLISLLVLIALQVSFSVYLDIKNIKVAESEVVLIEKEIKLAKSKLESDSLLEVSNRYKLDSLIQKRASVTGDSIFNSYE